MLGLIDKYIGPLIITLMAIFFMKVVLGNRFKIKRRYVLLVILASPIIIMLPSMFDQLFLRTLISCCVYMILFRVCFNISIYKSLIYSIIYMLLLTLSEILVFVILIDILKINTSYLYNVFAESIVSNFTICSMAIGLGFLLRKWLVKIDKMKVKNWVIMYTIILFICVVFFFYKTFSSIGKGINVFSGIMVILVLLAVLSSLIIQVYKNNQLMIKYDKLLDFIKKYEIEIDNQRTMRHEIKNQLLTIKSKLIDADENQSIINYINEIIEDNNKEINHTLYAKFNSMPSNGLKGLFYFKVSEAIDKKIMVSVNISKKISDSLLGNLNATMFNQLGKLFGILLDNAIESAELANKKKIGIEMYMNNNQVHFIVSNTYSSKVSYRKNGLFSSTKNENRGHGLLLAKAIINSNNRFSLNTMVTDDLFVQELVIK